MISNNKNKTINQIRTIVIKNKIRILETHKDFLEIKYNRINSNKKLVIQLIINLKIIDHHKIINFNIKVIKIINLNIIVIKTIVFVLIIIKTINYILIFNKTIVLFLIIITMYDKHLLSNTINRIDKTTTIIAQI